MKTDTEFSFWVALTGRVFNLERMRERRKRDFITKFSETFTSKSDTWHRLSFLRFSQRKNEYLICRGLEKEDH